MQQQFFPTSTRTELFLEMRMPEGTAIGATDAVAKTAEAMLTGDTDIATYTTYVGQGTPRFSLGLNPVLPNPGVAVTAAGGGAGAGGGLVAAGLPASSTGPAVLDRFGSACWPVPTLRCRSP